MHSVPLRGCACATRLAHRHPHPHRRWPARHTLLAHPHARAHTQRGLPTSGAAGAHTGQPRPPRQPGPQCVCWPARTHTCAHRRHDGGCAARALPAAPVASPAAARTHAPSVARDTAARQEGARCAVHARPLGCAQPEEGRRLAAMAPLWGRRRRGAGCGQERAGGGTRRVTRATPAPRMKSFCRGWAKLVHVCERFFCFGCQRPRRAGQK